MSGCTVDTTVRITAHGDGSGVVTVVTNLDPEAVQAAESGGGRLEDRVRVADLTRAGWTVGRWARANDGSARLTVSKPFGTPDELAAVLREVNGTAGPLRDVTLTRDDGFVTTDYRVRGRLDLASMATGVTTDPALVQSLSAQRVDPAAVDQSLLAQLRDSLRVRVVVATPGGTTTVTGKAGASVPIDVSTSVTEVRRLVFAAIAAVALVGAALLWWWPGRRARRTLTRGRRATRRASPETR